MANVGRLPKHDYGSLGLWPLLWLFIFVAIIAFGFISAVGVLYPGPEGLLNIISAAGVIFVPLTFLSYLPLIFFLSFHATERERGLNTATLDMSKIGWTHLVDEVKQWHFETFKTERYPIPITISLLTFFGWWTFVFFHSGPDVIGQFARDQQMQHLMEAVEAAPPVAFGFLGAYFYSISFLFFRFMSGDLGPNVYSHICVRTWTVTILVLVLTVLSRNTIGIEDLSIPSGTLIALSFLGGITPPVVLNMIKLFAKDKTKSLGLKEDSPEMGLQLIDGLSPFKVTRLAEEGIENLQNLAMEAPAKLVVLTQESGLVILDWIDQALLRTYMPKTEDYEKLVARGIRTSYDLYIAGINAAVVKELVDHWRVEPKESDFDGQTAGILTSLLNHANFHKIKRMREEAVGLVREETEVAKEGPGTYVREVIGPVDVAAPGSPS